MSRTSRRLADLIRSTEINRFIPVLENSGPNRTISIDKDDLKPELVDRLARYASALTVEGQNEFPIVNTPSRFGLQNSEGIPVGITNPGANDQFHLSEKFSKPDSNGVSAEELFNNTSNSGLLDTDSSRFVLKKGKSTVDAPTGNDIFEDINRNGENAEFVRRIRQVQVDNNRFTLGKTLIPRTGLNTESGISINSPGSSGDGSVSEDDSNIGVGYVQQEFGKHGPRKFPSVTGDTSTLIKLRNLKKLGLITMLEASGEYYVPKDPNDVAQQLAARGASFAPGLARIGKKVNLDRMNVLSVMKHVDPNFQKPTLEDNIKKEPTYTYGSVNNWIAPFDGLSSTAAIAGAAILSLTVGGLIKAAALIAAPKIPVDTIIPNANPTINDRRKRLGSYLGKNHQTSLFSETDSVINIAKTKYDYASCVSKGIGVFFGLNSIGTQLTKLAKNHGYYNTIMRALIRNTGDMISMAAGNFINPTGVTGVNDVTVLGNPLGPVELINKLNSSKLLGFCNILAKIGDITLGHEADGYIVDDDGGISEYISEIDSIIPDGDMGPHGEFSLNPAVMQSVNRLPGEYRNALAWGSNTIKSMYMIPSTLTRAETLYLGGTNQSSNPSEAMIADLSMNNLHVVKGPGRLDGNRIPAEEVREMEKHLEADYMPFYFHDLRTNEIIAFHAFLEDMSDGFNVDLTETEGYGRIGSVFTYKNTKRNISLSFRVVATNEKDFDHMWFKINKLVTLVYPQYTEGRQVGTSNDKFIRPFSQVPSASPLVRLRLGDLFKSNYSKFALARLFGLGTSQFSLQGQNNTITRNSAFSANVTQVRTRMGTNGIYEVGEYAMLTPLPNIRGSGASQRVVGFPRVANQMTTDPSASPVSRQGPRARRGTSIPSAITSINPTGSRVSTPTLSPGGIPLQINVQTRVLIQRVRERNGLRIYDFTVPNGGIGQDGIYACSQHDLTPDPREITRIAANQTTTPDIAASGSLNQSNLITSFFDGSGENGNSIIRAFESTQGKGLAGFIKSLNFDWSEARWETGRNNARAPMSVKISMEFAPIHDISPGLDSGGFMTAPVYGTGETIKAFNEMPDQQIRNNSDADSIQRASNASNDRPSINQNIINNGSRGII